MSKENFDLKQKEIAAISDEDVKLPNMPVGEAVQEAENLFAWCMGDKAALTKAGLDWALVDDLPLRAGACRYAESLWKRDSKTSEEAEKEWKLKSPEGFDLRDRLQHHLTFAFRKDPEQLAKVQTIREGSSRADMLQDLSDLSVLGKSQPALLKQIGFDMSMLGQAAQMSDDLSAVLALVNGEDTVEDNTKKMRDKAYTYMKQAMDEIRTTGQYVFWRDEDRKKGYVSTYQKRLNQRRKGDDPGKSGLE
jgi:GTP cyclohydrolase II